MTLLVLEVHATNLLFLWCLSFAFKIKAYRIRPHCPRILSKRIEVLDLDRYFSTNSSHCFKSSVVAEWEKLLDRFPIDTWRAQYDGHTLDFSTKAKQSLGGSFERLVMLREILNQEIATSRFYILDSFEFQYLKTNRATRHLYGYPTAPILSWINAFLDRLFAYTVVIRSTATLLARILNGFIFAPDYRTSGRHQPITFLWNGVNPDELSIDPERRSFPWIVDNKYIQKEDVLFILPSIRNANLEEFSSKYQAHTFEELYRNMPRKALLRCLRDLLVVISKYMMPYPRGFTTIQKASYLLSTITLKPLIQQFRFSCYVSSMSDLGNEVPGVVYLRAVGIKTVMYSYSASYYRPGDEHCTCDFRTVNWANVLSSKLVVWHKDAKNLMEKHPQRDVEVEVIGPLMAGDESVCQIPKDPLRSRFNISLGPRPRHSNLQYISVFDLPVWSRKINNSYGQYPSIHTDEYAAFFMQDMYSLLKQFENVVILFKPLRSLGDVRIDYTAEYLEAVRGIESSQRGFVLNDDINPWLPVAASDMCIAMPFTVPPLVGMHYGIPGLFHDPTGNIHLNKYGTISHCVTHGYDQLKAKLESLMACDFRSNRIRQTGIWSESVEFIGKQPGTNSSDSFRKLLLESSLHVPDRS